MVKINRKVEYALIILRHMRQLGAEGRVTAKEMEENYHLSFDVASKVMQLLSQNGYLHSAKGAHGGYSLAKDFSRLSFLELHEIIQGPMTVASCLHTEGSSCDLTGDCNIIAPIVALNERVTELYRTLLVGDLLDQADRSDYRKSEGDIREKYIATAAAH